MSIKQFFQTAKPNDRVQITKFQRAIGNWYSKNKRDLPWRNQDNAYAIWVSEIMLQQTQVATVVPFFQRFLARFPSPNELADAEESAVLKLWEGLGYYRRARQLHNAAKIIRDQFNGAFPVDFDDILSLPGIGRYTAGAICSFAYDQSQPIVEANTQRLYSRLYGETELLSKPKAQKRLWQFAETIVPNKSPGNFNQALMELGSLVCTPKTPSCKSCPVSEFCTAFQTDRVSQIPTPKPKKQFEERHHIAICIQDSKNRWLIRLCPEDEHWSGLWDFPRFDITSGQAERPGNTISSARKQPIVGQEFIDCVTSGFTEHFGRSIELGEKFKTIRHGVTRFKIQLDCYSAKFVDRAKLQTAYDYKWVANDELSDIALNSSGRKIAIQLSKARQLKLTL